MVDTYNEYDDIELIDLIKKQDEDALKVMFAKYEALIKSKIAKFKFEKKNLEDYLQEGRIMLYKAIEKYDKNSPKTFNKYFELILTNHFLSIIRKDKKKIEVSYFSEEYIGDEWKNIDEKIENSEFLNLYFSEYEKKIYELRFLKKYKISEICEFLKRKEKSVYNTIQRIKRKFNDLK